MEKEIKGYNGKRMTRGQIIKGLIFVALISVFVYVIIPIGQPFARLATGYASKYVCSHVFVSKLTDQRAIEGIGISPIRSATVKVDRSQQSVTSTLWGMGKRTAYYYEKGALCGCTLDKKMDLSSLPSIPAPPAVSDTIFWPRGSKLKEAETQSQEKTLQEILTKATTNNDQIYAINVANGQGDLFEAYGSGIDQSTRLLGWSMTKTFNTLLYGMLELSGSIDVNTSAQVTEWKEGDRSAITYANLLQMNSGLDWEENYFKISDATRMLFFSEDVSEIPLTPGFEAERGKFWEYSSGSSNILSELLRDRLGENYHSFVIDSLFGKLNMPSARIETDLDGNFVMSSYGWATARDWTRFGLAFLKEGRLTQDTIMDADYYQFATHDDHVSDGHYGAHIWLNKSGEYPSVPSGAFFADGFGGQRVLVVPSKDLVITVLTGYAPQFDLNELFAKILENQN